METPKKASICKKLFIVLSGKGGVGKSSVCAQLAFALHSKGHRVGVLDLDLCGPSLPKMFNMEDGAIEQGENGWMPVYFDPEEKRLGLMSIGFLLNSKEDAVIWRGPKKTFELSMDRNQRAAMIKRFMSDVDWEQLDYLLVDTPPGTSDEHIALVECLKEKPELTESYAAILVTTPQNLSVNDVRREITFCHKVGLPIAGIVENMSGYTCPHCAECTFIFTKHGGQMLAEKTDCPYLGAIPIDPSMTSSLETSAANFYDAVKSSPIFAHVTAIADKLIA